jgi:glycogen synthase
MTTDAVGGVWTYALGLARELGAAGGEVVLAVMGPPPDAAKAAAARAVPGLALEVGEFDLEWMDDPWRDVERAGAWLLGLAERYEPEVVHLNGYVHADLPWRAPVLVVAHSCVVSWWQAVKGEAAPTTWTEYRRRVRRGVAAADLVVAPTRAMLEAVTEHHGPVPRARVIPNGADPCPVVPLRKEPIAVTVGRLWDEAKNVATLTTIAAELPWPVFLIGDPEPPGGAASAWSDVRVLGPLPPAAVVAWLARAAVYVHPARYEPFGLSVLEAAHAGCALVLADIPSLRETWGDAAAYTPPDDPDALRDVLRRVMGDAVLRGGLAARSRDRAASLTLGRSAAAYRHAYAQLLRTAVAA